MMFNLKCFLLLLIIPSLAWSGLGGPPVAGIAGPSSVNFNPAGLVRAPGKMVTLAISPILSQGDSPMGVSYQQVKSKKSVILPYGVYGKMDLGKRFSLGVGSYYLGGNTIDFGNVNMTNANANWDELKPDVSINIRLYDFVLAAGYRLNDNWNLGLGARATLTKYDLGGLGVAPTIQTNVIYSNQKDWSFPSIVAGVQYLGDSKTWGWGLTYKTRVKYKAEGSSIAYYELSTAGSARTRLGGGGPVHSIGRYPSEIVFGGFTVIGRGNVLWGQYSWADWSIANEERYGGNPLTLFGADILPTPALQKFKDTHSFEIGGEIPLSPVWKFRPQIGTTSALTSTTHAKPTFFPPARIWSGTIGFGKLWPKQGISFDFGGFYVFTHAKNVSTDVGIEGNVNRDMLGGFGSLTFSL